MLELSETLSSSECKGLGTVVTEIFSPSNLILFLCQASGVILRNRWGLMGDMLVRSV